MTDDGPTERVAVRIPDALANELDERIERGQFLHRSEAIRQALRQQFAETPPAGASPFGGDD